MVLPGFPWVDDWIWSSPEGDHGDLRDRERLEQAILQCQPEFVFHLAAQPLVLRSYQEPVETFATNVLGTVHVLDAVRCCPTVRAVINVTSDKCYENREWVWGYRENDPMRLMGFVGCPQDACTEVKTLAHYISPLRGGEGAVRDVIAFILRARGQWDEAVRQVYHID